MQRQAGGSCFSLQLCVEQETLISAGGGKNCQTRAKQSAEFSNVDIDIHNMQYVIYVFDSVCEASQFQRQTIIE